MGSKKKEMKGPRETLEEREIRVNKKMCLRCCGWMLDCEGEEDGSGDHQQ